MATGEELKNTNTNRTEIPQWLNDMINAELFISKAKETDVNDKRFFCADCGGHAITESEKQNDHAGHIVVKAFCRRKRYGYLKGHLELLRSKGLDVSDIAAYSSDFQQSVIIYPKPKPSEDRKRTVDGYYCNTCGCDMRKGGSFCSISCMLTGTSKIAQRKFARKSAAVNDQEFKKQEDGISISEDVKKKKAPIPKGELIKDMIYAEFVINKNYFCFDCGGHALTESEKEKDHKSHAVIKAVKGGQTYGFPAKDLEELARSKGLDISGVILFRSTSGYLVFQKPPPPEPTCSRISERSKKCDTSGDALLNCIGPFCCLLCKFINDVDDQMKVPKVLDVNKQKVGSSDNQLGRNNAEGEMTSKYVNDGYSAIVSDVRKRRREETNCPPPRKPFR